MQTAVLPVDESFKCFRFKKETNTYSKHECVSQMARMVNPILSKQFCTAAVQGTNCPGSIIGFKASAAHEMCQQSRKRNPAFADAAELKRLKIATRESSSHVFTPVKRSSCWPRSSHDDKKHRARGHPPADIYNR
jgi:hypothetical protein